LERSYNAGTGKNKPLHKLLAPFCASNLFDPPYVFLGSNTIQI